MATKKKKNEYLCALNIWGVREPETIDAYTPEEAARIYAADYVDVEADNEVLVFPMSCAIRFTAWTQMVEVK
jgi:hypothetical protein